MKFVGITSCTVGIAHTYMAREKLLEAGKELGMEGYVETQGSAGVEFVLTEDNINGADVAIIAADVAVVGEDRFKGKMPLVHVPTNTAIQNPKSLLLTIQKKLVK